MALCILSVASVGSGHGSEGTSRMVTAESLSVISYKFVCDATYMENIKRIVFLKAFMNFETHTNPLQELKEEIVEEIRTFITTLEQYIVDLKVQINNVQALPPPYMLSKLNNMVSRVYDVINGPSLEHQNKVGEAPEESNQASEIKQVMENIKVEIALKPFTHSYLTSAKEQIDNNGGDDELQGSIPVFINQLPTYLDDILTFVLEKGPHDQEKIQYLIDFFDVFGTLLPRNKVNQIVLNHVSHHPTDKPTHANSKEPVTLQQIRAFKEFPSLVNNPFFSIIAVDKLFSHDDSLFHKLQDIKGVHTPSYTYHPEWLTFFDIPSKEKQGLIKVTHEVEEEKEKLIKDGHTYIYYFYVNARDQGGIPNEKDSLKGIASKLYEDILTTNCYSDIDKCRLAKILPREIFTTHYMVMLALLKPFTDQPEFNDKDIDAILQQTNKYGAENIEFSLPNVAPFFENLRKDTVAKKTAQLDSDLRDIVSGLKQAQLDKEPDHFVKKKKLRNTLNAGLPAVEEKFKQLYPGLNELPTDENKLRTFLDDVDTITTTIAKGSPETGSVLFKIVGKKLSDLNNINEDLVREKFEKEGLEQPETVPENENLIAIKKKINEWTLNQIHNKSEIPDNHGFIKYLENTIHRRRNLKAAAGDPFFSEHIYNMIRKYDIYIFLYRIKLKYMSQKELENNQEKKDLLEYEGIDVEAMASDMTIFESTHVFEFMPEFFDLFSYFELNHSTTDESKYNSEFSMPFDELYKFLIELRSRASSTEENPRIVAFREIFDCMGHQYNRVINDTPVPYEEFTPTDFEDEELTNAEFTVWDNARLCRQSYSRLSNFYYFLYIDVVGAHPQLGDKHDEFFADHLLVNTDLFYNYMIYANNSLKTAFADICAQRPDFVCKGFAIYENLKTLLQKNDKELTASGATIGGLIAEKIDHIQTPARFENQDNTEVIRVTVWNIICGLATDGKKFTSTYAGLDYLIDSNALNLSIIGMDPDENDETTIDLLARFIALRFGLIQNDDTKTSKIVDAVDEFMNKKASDKYLLIDVNTFVPSNAKFLVDYIQTFAQFREVARIMAEYKAIHYMLRWPIGPLYGDKSYSELTSAIDKTTNNDAGASAIGAHFTMMMSKRAEAIQQVKKKQNKPAINSMMGLGGLGGPAKKPASSSLSAQKNVQKPKNPVADSKVSRQTDSLLVSEATGSKLDLAFKKRGSITDCVELRDYYDTGITSQFIDRPNARDILNNTQKTDNDPVTIIEHDQELVDAAVKHEVSVAMVEINAKIEEIKRLRRRRVVV